MHEYSVVQSIFAAAEREVERAGALAVHRLTLRIGDAAGVDAGLLRKAYDVCRRGTVCAGADLAIIAEAARWSCPKCGHDIAAGAALRCAGCDVPASLAAGDALILERLELEVP